MREIKFRLWSRNNYMIENLSLFALGLEYRGEDTPTMQYTGIKDINGKEIYEGDILNHSYLQGYSEVPSSYQCVVKYGLMKDCCGEIYGIGFNLGSDVDWEVIGNIYEDPELLDIIGEKNETN